MEGVCLLLEVSAARQAAAFCKTHPAVRCVALTARCQEALADLGQTAQVLPCPVTRWDELHREMATARGESLAADLFSHFRIEQEQGARLLEKALATLPGPVVTFGVVR